MMINLAKVTLKLCTLRLANLHVCSIKQRPWALSSSHWFNTHSSCSAPHNTDFDEKILDILACPLSKKPLRFDKQKNVLICDDIRVAYPIVNGIPNLIPQDASMLKNEGSTTEASNKES